MLSAKNSFCYVAAGFFLFFSALPLSKMVAAQAKQSLDSQIVNAKTAFLTAEILHAKDDKQPFTSELNTIGNIANETKIWAVYKPATAEKADIIMKIEEDRTFGAAWTLTLHVYDPEDNRELYTEKRDYVELTNDIHRLMNHLLNAVVEQKTMGRLGVQREAEKEKAPREQVRSIGTAEVTCNNVKLFANRGAERRVRLILNKGDRMTVVTLANSEVVVKVGDVWGYVDAECVRVLQTN